MCAVLHVNSWLSAQLNAVWLFQNKPYIKSSSKVFDHGLRKTYSRIRPSYKPLCKYLIYYTVDQHWHRASRLGLPPYAGPTPCTEVFRDSIPHGRKLHTRGVLVWGFKLSLTWYHLISYDLEMCAGPDGISRREMENFPRAGRGICNLQSRVGISERESAFASRPIPRSGGKWPPVPVPRTSLIIFVHLMGDGDSDHYPNPAFRLLRPHYDFHYRNILHLDIPHLLRKRSSCSTSKIITLGYQYVITNSSKKLLPVGIKMPIPWTAR